MAVLNLSFAGCGFMGIYQLGVLGAFLRHGERLLQDLQACAGASAGALVATVLVTAPDKLEHCKEFTYRFASEVRRQKLGALTPGYDFMLTLREGIEEILPPDAHQMAGDRLHISLTNSRTMRNRMVSRFASRENLIKVLLASSFVPVYAGIKAVEYQGQHWIDGGLTDSLPILPVGRTITVSPFSGHQDICPQHNGLANLHLMLANMDVIVIDFVPAYSTLPACSGPWTEAEYYTDMAYLMVTKSRPFPSFLIKVDPGARTPLFQLTRNFPKPQRSGMDLFKHHLDNSRSK